MEYNDLINNLLNTLDNNKDIIEIKKLKNKLLNNKPFLEEINNYKKNQTVDNKKKLYKNLDYVEYLHLETNINFLIQSIKQKLKLSKGSICK